MWMTFAVIICTIVAFAREKWSIEGVSLAALVALLALFSLVPQPFAEPVTATDLLMGFANPALVTVLALLVIDRRCLIPMRWNGPQRSCPNLVAAAQGEPYWSCCSPQA